MCAEVDWSIRGGYIYEKHGVAVTEANEALSDPNRLTIDPDYASRSGRAVRIIGHSATADAVLTVLVLTDSGTDYGVNAWHSNAKDRRLYQRGTDR